MLARYAGEDPRQALAVAAPEQVPERHGLAPTGERRAAGRDPQSGSAQHRTADQYLPAGQSRSAPAFPLHAGQIKVNAPTTGVDFHLPFGGENRSSFGGREQGKAAMDFYTSLHTVTVAPRGGS